MPTRMAFEGRLLEEHDAVPKDIAEIYVDGASFSLISSSTSKVVFHRIRDVDADGDPVSSNILVVTMPTNQLVRLCMLALSQVTETRDSLKAELATSEALFQRVADAHVSADLG